MEPALARALAALTTGIYVLTVRAGDRRHGMSSSWVTQVSGDPPLLMASVDRRHFTHDILARSGRFALNIVGERGRRLEDYFYSAASRRPDNLDAVSWDDSPEGLPLLRDAMVSLECRVEHVVAAGDHTLFVAAVERVTSRDDDRPLTSQDLDYVYVGEVVRRARKAQSPVPQQLMRFWKRFARGELRLTRIEVRARRRSGGTGRPRSRR